MAIMEYEALIGVAIAIILNYITIYRKSKIVGDLVFVILGLIMLIPFLNTDYVAIAFGVVFIGFTDMGMNFTSIKKKKK